VEQMQTYNSELLELAARAKALADELQKLANKIKHLEYTKKVENCTYGEQLSLF